MKTKILFVQESLRLAGSEKSMVTLLKNLNPDKYDIDVQLVSYGGELEKELPEFINLLPVLEFKRKIDVSIFKQLLSIKRLNDLKLFIERLKYSIGIRKSKLHLSQKSQLFWETIGRAIPVFKKEYDVAIGYTQGFPTFYVADKVKARKKVCWVNANFIQKDEYLKFFEKYYLKFDNVVCVTSRNLEWTRNLFPGLKNLILIEDIVDYNAIVKASNEKTVNFKSNIVNILTVGRLEVKAKGTDIAIEAVKRLRNKTDKFHWYFLGEGPFRNEMVVFIEKENLQDYVTLLGTDLNPYPYFKAADIYVQTSRHEGYGISIAEARLLNLPIITTRFDTVFEQMIDGINGLVVDINPEAIADGIQKLINDKTLYNSIVDYLKSEPKENLESVEKFRKMVESL